MVESVRPFMVLDIVSMDESVAPLIGRRGVHDGAGSGVYDGGSGVHDGGRGVHADGGRGFILMVDVRSLVVDGVHGVGCGVCVCVWCRWMFGPQWRCCVRDCDGR